MSDKKTYGTWANGKIQIINGTSCSKGYCTQQGCDFPDCATFNGEKFKSVKDAEKIYTDFELV